MTAPGHVAGAPRRGASPASARRAATPRRRWRAGAPRRRLAVVVAAAAVAFALALWHVGLLQTANADVYVAEGDTQRLRTVSLPGDRGTIFDRNGYELAMSVPSTTLWADPRLIEDRVGTIVALAGPLRWDQATANAALVRLNSGGEFAYLARQIDADVAAAVKALGLPGVFSYLEPRRVRPAGSLAAGVLGGTDPDGKGTGGLEKQYESVLAGVPGSLIRERDREGRSIPLGVDRVVAPQAGSDLVLTVDRQLQYAVEELTVRRVEETKAKGGMVVVLDTRSGDILALANVRRDAKTQKVAVSSANNALVDTYEPGSVAKIIAGSGAIEEGTTTLEQVWQVPGSLQITKEHVVYDAEGPRAPVTMDMETIIARSSNIGTVLLARSIGSTRVDHYLRAFGFGTTTGLGFPDESPGLLPPLSRWNDAQKATIPYGQGFGVTLVQLAGAMNTLANRGTYVAPRLVRATIDPEGVQHPAAPSPTRAAVSPATAVAMTEALKGVICREDGTAKERAAVAGYPVAGKTGTAYKPQTPPYKAPDGTIDGYRDKDGNHHYVTSFEGFLPADDPKLTIVVTIDEPDPYRFQSGAVAAAPLFRLVAQETVRIQRIAPTGGDCAGAKVR